MLGLCVYTQQMVPRFAFILNKTTGIENNVNRV
jgi:hypothetical protein